MGSATTDAWKYIVELVTPKLTNDTTNIAASAATKCADCIFTVGDKSCASITIERLGNEKSKGVVIKNALPFEVSYVGKTYAITTMLLVHPAPFQIESVGADAFLYCVGSGITVMIPIKIGNPNSASAKFFEKFVDQTKFIYWNGEPPGEGEKKPASTTTVSTGSDWKLSSLVDPNAGYFIWTSAGVQKKETRRDEKNRKIYIAEQPVIGGDVYILIEKAAEISPADFQLITQMDPLPPDSNDTKQLTGIAKGPALFYNTKPKSCKKCFRVVKSSDEETNNDFDDSSTEMSNAIVDAQEVLGVAGYLVFLAIMLLFMSIVVYAFVLLVSGFVNQDLSGAMQKFTDLMVTLANMPINIAKSLFTSIAGVFQQSSN